MGDEDLKEMKRRWEEKAREREREREKNDMKYCGSNKSIVAVFGEV